MATRGYFTIEMDDKNDKSPYTHFDDILMEAYHDGYMDGMIMDVLQIAPRLVELLKMKERGKYYTMGYIFGIHSKRKLIKKTIKFEEFLDYASSVSIFDIVPANFSELICISNPLKYTAISPGVERYGHPVGFDCSYFKLKYIFDDMKMKRNRGKVEIRFTEDLDEENEVGLAETIDEINEQYGYGEDAKIKIEKDNDGKPMVCFDLLRQLYFLSYQELISEEKKKN